MSEWREGYAVHVSCPCGRIDEIRRDRCGTCSGVGWVQGDDPRRGEVPCDSCRGTGIGGFPARGARCPACDLDLSAEVVFDPDPVPLGAIQFRRALALAAAHGHLWAEVLDSRGPGAPLADLARFGRLTLAAIVQDPRWATERRAEAVALREALGDTPSPTEIARAVAGSATGRRNAELGLPGGIPCPDRGVRGDPQAPVYHRTGSGRLQWMIEQDGDLTLRVMRPSNHDEPGAYGGEPGDDGIPCLVAQVSPEGAVRVQETGEAPAEDRHWEALAYALGAVVGPSAVVAALGSARPVRPSDDAGAPALSEHRERW